MSHFDPTAAQAALGDAIERRPPWMSVMTAACIFYGSDEEIRAAEYEFKDGSGFCPVIERYHLDHWEPYVTWERTPLPKGKAVGFAASCIAHIKGS